LGTYLVQLAVLAGVHVTPARSSNTRNGFLLHELGVDEAVEYSDLQDVKYASSFDVIIDTVGSHTLKTSWSLVKNTGILAFLDFGSYNFVEEHGLLPFTKGKETVRAIWFLVHPSGKQLKCIGEGMELGLLKAYMAEELPLAEAARAYKVGNGKMSNTGKVVLDI